MATLVKDLKQLESLGKKGKTRIFPGKVKIAVQMGTCGRASGADKLYSELEKALKGTDVVLARTGCIGLCQLEPMLNVMVPGLAPVIYSQLTPKKMEKLIPEWIDGKTPGKHALMQLNNSGFKVDGVDNKKAADIKEYKEVPFYKPQFKIALRNSGLVDPLDISEYIARGGYRSLYNVLTGLKPDDIVDTVTEAGLRGRGGGGFPTGRKWRSCSKASGSPKYVICNADEGDPGAYMDRTVLEGDPFSVLEGMAIGAYGIGSTEGYIYVRAEYPLAVETLRKTIAVAREHGLLGKNIFGTDFSFDIKISRGGGAFVCGESTALMASIEGKVGEPRVKHIHTVEAGLREKPTTLNNVETWSNVPIIFKMGAKEYASIGTEGSKGTKVFSLVGKINNNGLVEVPMGLSLREIIYDVGGGIPGDKKFKAVQTGGPSGGCIPADKIDMPVDFDELTKVGSMMGSGGIIVMDEDTCMVDVARYFLSFLVEESCGKCTPCREGTYQLYKIVDRISEGKGKDGDVELLEELSEVIKHCSLCALGKSAPNPVLSTIRYFRDEYMTHVKEKKCPAGVCKALFEFEIDAEACAKSMCGACYKKCPADAISWKKKEIAVLDKAKCTKCGICFDVCKFDSVNKV
ncbi:NADH-ubiquinone oxidoreductase-F iron-sulfur binding region domain-containing protein [Fibrobacterota bacterium]